MNPKRHKQKNQYLTGNPTTKKKSSIYLNAVNSTTKRKKECMKQNQITGNCKPRTGDSQSPAPQLLCDWLGDVSMGMCVLHVA